MNKSIILVGAGLGPGGTERAITMLANKFCELGMNVTIISVFQTEVFYNLNQNIKVIKPQYPKEKIYLFHVLKSIYYLRRAIKSCDSNTILTLNDWINPIVLFAALLTGKKVFVSERISPTRRLGFFHDAFKKFSYKLATGFISQTTIAKNILSKQIDPKFITVIPNAVECFDSSSYSLPKEKYIVSVGRLSEEKGHTFLIQAFSKIRNKEWSLHLIGDGNKRTYLTNLANDLKISGRVHFYGFQKDFYNLLQQSEIFVLPSLSEGFPNALLEAMSVPLACISSDCIAGPGDIIQHGINGVLVKPGDVTELTAAIENLITNKAYRDSLAKEAYKVRSTYDFETIAKRYLEFMLPEGIN
jgi:glycosyltransferase involved in cell wall biosynthesis